MADMFSKSDACELLVGRHILFIGDSNTRAQYKDLLWLLDSNTLINIRPLRSRLEPSFLGDQLVNKCFTSYSRDFKEVRKKYYEESGTIVEFVFITRCYSVEVENLFNMFRTGLTHCPDVIVMNSCVWDLTRWGPNGVPHYRQNLVNLMRLMVKCIPMWCLVIWTTTMPPAARVRGGLIIKQVECMEPLLRFEVMEANTYARSTLVSYGFDVLDFHYVNRMQVHRRAKDGIHFLPIPVRLNTNLILTHIALSWGCPLPNNVKNRLLDRAITQDSVKLLKSVVKLPSPGIFGKINLQPPVATKKTELTVTMFNDDTFTSCRRRLIQSQPDEPPALCDQGPWRHRNYRKNKRFRKQQLYF